jgi:hypothetical protein
MFDANNVVKQCHILSYLSNWSLQSCFQVLGPQLDTGICEYFILSFGIWDLIGAAHARAGFGSTTPSTHTFASPDLLDLLEML